MTKRILVITDCTDIAAHELRATLVATLDKLKAKNVVVEPIVHVKEFSILHGSFSARLLAEAYNPKDLTIMAVVNPLNTLSSKRARIAGRLNNGIHFVGANTGIFSWLIKDFELAEIVETDRTGLNGKNFISFGGKYIHAPIAAKVAMTGNIESVKLREFKEKDLTTFCYEPGSIVHIDNFGVLKIMLKASQFEATLGQKFGVFHKRKKIAVATFCYSMKELADGELAIYKGSSLDLLELGTVRQLDTSRKLRLEIGDIITLRAL